MIEEDMKIPLPVFRKKQLIFILPAAILILMGIALVLAPSVDSFLHPYRNVPDTASPLAGQVLYLSPIDQPDLWTVARDGLAPVQLTHTGGKVLDFSVSPDGWQVLYSVQNMQGGSDLYILRLDGSMDQEVVSCGGESCDSPVWACDGKKAVYRRGTTPLIDMQRGQIQKLSSQIYTLDIPTNRTAVFQPDRNFTGITPNWSTDCKYFSFYDTDIDSIRIIDLTSDKGNVLLPAIFQAWWSWSPDGHYMYFINQSTPEDFSHAAVYRYDLKTGSADLAFKASAENYDYSPVSFALDGTMVYGRREIGINPARQLWLTMPGNATPSQITSEEASTHTNARWDSDGEAIVYQQFELSNTEAVPEVRVWDKTSRQSVTVAVNAGYPAWVPSK
jgi:Tol biopolymer transport system component